MLDPSQVWLTLSVADSDLDQQELEDLTQNLQNQIREIAEEVDRVPANEVTGKGLIAKGDQSEPGVLKVQVGVDGIKQLAAFLYERLVGKPTKAKVKFGEGSGAIEFEFEGNNQRDLAATMQDVTVFVEKVIQLQNAKS